jgi:NADH-quinone oxidoreductase subunit E
MEAPTSTVELPPEDRERLLAAARHFADRRSAILPGLHIAYDRFGHVNLDLCRQIAQVLGLPAVWVVEAATFYTFFPKQRVGRFHIKVCDNLSCALNGACDMIRYLEQKHGIRRGQVTSDGLFSLVGEECLAACSGAPMLQLNDEYHENLTPEKLDLLIEECRAKAAGEARESRARA